MKKLFLLCLLFCFSFIAVSNGSTINNKQTYENTNNDFSNFEQIHIQKDQERLAQDRQVLDEKMDMYFDRKTRKYKPGITEKDKAQYYQYFIELRALGNQIVTRPSGYHKMIYDRFDRSSVQITLTENQLYKMEQKIQTNLDQCIKNSQPKDTLYNLYIDLPQSLGDRPLSYDVSFIDEREYDSSKYMVQNYLYGRVNRCVYYLYDDPLNYDLSDFDYTQKTTHYLQIEKLYEQAYLKIRAAGLLRKLPGAYYPKSFVRAHADATGLTKYIQRQEKKAGRHLPHKYLAADYFGSHKQWIHSLNDYINSIKIDSIGNQ